MKDAHMKKLCLPVVLGLLLLPGTNVLLHAQQTNHPSVRDTVAGVITRLKREMPADELQKLTPDQAEQFLTPQEREILAGEHVTFRVNVPVRLTVLRDTRLGSQPFWLRTRGFQQTDIRLRHSKVVFDAWQKDFAPGPVGLGVHSLSGGSDHYLVTLAPQHAGDQIKVTDLYPPQLELATLKAGVEPYIDQPDVLTAVPPELEGQLLIRTDTDREEDARFVGVFRVTQYPASERPDQIVLTWSEDPRTSQTIQWRTSTKVAQGHVQYQAKPANKSAQAPNPSRATANTVKLETLTLLNDPVIHRHTAVLRGLSLGTTYTYSVGDGSEAGWTEPAEFTTAPSSTQSFSFIYMGDAQNGLDKWGTLAHTSLRSHPEGAFYLMAGDLVNRGAERDDWDSLFYNAQGVWTHRPVMPTIGNHECQGGKPKLYLKEFALPVNGPKEIEPERVYSFEYGNALFVVLDGNLAPASQAAWLEQKLSHTQSTWKFVMFHQPAYSSGGNRDNAGLRAAWTPLFDKYHVDMVLQGHDHAYLRTYPMRAGQRVASPKEGTVYVISVSGTKSYPQPKHDYTEVGMTKVATFQVLDIQTNPNRLQYRACDADTKVRDELVIEK
jgi:acid phosphatase type 7